MNPPLAGDFAGLPQLTLVNTLRRLGRFFNWPLGGICHDLTAVASSAREAIMVR